MSKRDNFAATIEAELEHACGTALPVDILRWLLERQKIYVGRWLGFVSLKQISPRALVENDFFLVISVCADRIDTQLKSVFVDSEALRHWQEFIGAMDDIRGDFSLTKAQLLDPALTRFIFELDQQKK